MLVPTNSSESFGNAALVGTLDIGSSETHTYRIAMTAGKTYTFDDTYRRWALMSGEWWGDEHFYLPDEFRISLYTKNSAGQLEPVTGFQNQDFQLTYGEPGFQTWPFELVSDSSSPSHIPYTNREYFENVRNLLFVFDNAHFFPPGSQHDHICEIAPSSPSEKQHR